MWAVLLLVVLWGTYALNIWEHAAEFQGFSFLSGHPTRGASLFSDFGCNACHALYGIGPDVGPDLSMVPPGSENPVRLVADMWNHSPQMWKRMKDTTLSFPNIGEQDMLDLLAYLYLVRYVDVQGDKNKGEELFSSKNCQNCHTISGTPAGIGPDLSRLEADTPIIWAQRMWNHGKGMEALMGKMDIPWPTFQGREMPDLLAFLQEKSSGKRQEAALLPASPAQGKTLFRNKGCISCHSIDGQGGQLGPDLGSRHEVPPSITEFAGLMWNHSPNMLDQMEKQETPRPQFAEREMADLIAYLYVVHYLEPVGRVDLGQQAFHEKHCSNCHGADGHGGRGGPNLARQQPYFSSHLAYTVWSHGPEMYRRMQEQNIGWPSLSENELTNLLAFLNSL